MSHDFNRFPELTNRQMDIYYFMSPHKQITEDFRAKVVKVHDGDTIRVECDFRDFDFPIRIADLAAPELNEKGGVESQSWLENKILNKEVDIELTPQRVEKWGRLLARVLFTGMSMAEESIAMGKAISWKEKMQEVRL